jgi:cysteine-rich repeat protein
MFKYFLIVFCASIIALAQVSRVSSEVQNNEDSKTNSGGDIQTTSTPSGCGDGKVSADNNEECDDGNQADGDGCSSSCTLEFCCINYECVKSNGSNCAGKTFYTDESSCATSNECDCEKYCKSQSKKYFDGWNKKTGDDIGLECKTDDDSHRILGNCCCKKCAIDDVECNCQYGDDSDVFLAAEKHRNKCCAGGVPIGVPGVPIPNVELVRELPGGACGVCTNCGGTPPCGKIKIAVCSGISACGDTCATTIHESQHFIKCNLDQSGNKDTCTGISEHIKIENNINNWCKTGEGIYPECNIGCDATFLENYCSNYKSNKCPASEELKSICDNANKSEEEEEEPPPKK